MNREKPLLTLVRDELVGMDRDQVINLLHQKALRELVETLRDNESVIVVRRPGEPLPDENAFLLNVFLERTGFSLPRTADLRALLELAAGVGRPMTNTEADAYQRVWATVQTAEAVS